MNNRTKILIVEDNPGDIMLIREALEGENEIDVIDVATNGEQAIKYLARKGEFAEKSRPNLVILDINLPRVNGHEVLEYIKKNESTKEMPVVMLSSSSSESDISASYNNFANCYITKPIGVDNFNDVIHDIKNFWFKVARLPDRSYSS